MTTELMQRLGKAVTLIPQMEKALQEDKTLDRKDIRKTRRLIQGLEAAQTTIRQQAERIAVMEEALAPSGETKAAYMGEFKFDEREFNFEDDTEITRSRIVPWTTIKEIMAAILRRAAAARSGKEG